MPRRTTTTTTKKKPAAKRTKPKRRKPSLLNPELYQSLRFFLSATRDHIISEYGKNDSTYRAKIWKTKHGPLVHLSTGVSRVLGVAHLDTVDFRDNYTISGVRLDNFGSAGRHGRFFRPAKQPIPAPETHCDRYVSKCPQLDDRLGAWVLLELLPSLGVATDVLLTDSEEVGQSTAQYFAEKCSQEYNWIYSFDRAGSDVVCYTYETPELVELLEEVGFAVGHGSYSDICYLTSLGVSGANFGTGYHSQHTPHCYADLLETINSAKRFQHFYRENKGSRLDYSPPIIKPLFRREPVSWLPYDLPTSCNADDLDDINYCTDCGNELLCNVENCFCPLCDASALRIILDSAFQNSQNLSARQAE